MKYPFEKKPLSVILSIVFCIVGLIALIPIFLLIEYLFKDNFTYGVLLFVGIVLVGLYLFAHFMEKKAKAKTNDKKAKNNDCFDISDDVIEELENQATALVALTSSAEAMPGIENSFLSSYLKGMKVANTPSNRKRLMEFSKQLENVINSKNDLPNKEYNRLLFKTYQENITLFEKI